MDILTSKPKLKRMGFFLGSACLVVAIFSGLAGCSSQVPEVASPVDTPTNAGRSVKPLEISLLQIKQTGLSSNGLDLNIEAKVKNNNPFAVNLENPVVRIQGVTGNNYSQITADGGQIAEQSAQIYNFSTTLPATFFNEQNMTVRLDFNSEYAGKTLPVSDTTTLNLRKILNNVYVKPEISLQAKFEKISWNGSKTQVEAQVMGTINNPSPVNLAISVIRFVVQDSQARAIGAGLISNSFTVAPKSNHPFETSIILPVEALNDPDITVVADVTASSLYSMSSFQAKTFMNKYTLADLIEVPQMEFDPQASWSKINSAITLELTIKTSLTNDNQYDLTAGQLVIKVYKPAGTLAATATQTGFLSGLPASNTKTMTNLITLYPGDVSDVGGNAIITASLPVGIENVNQTILVSGSMTYTVRP